MKSPLQQLVIIALVLLTSVAVVKPNDRVSRRATLEMNGTAGVSRLLHYPLATQSNNPADPDVPANRRERLLQNEVQIFDERKDHDGLFRGLGTHYVHLYVGCPNPQLQTLIVDTGSSVTGFPCSACKEDCGEGYQLNPVFNELDSTCFRPITCDRSNSTECLCRDNQCFISRRYVEGSSWSGTESTDVATIGGNLEGLEEPFTLNFACQDSITGLFQTQLADGITGLAKHQNSLWSQLYEQDVIDKPQFSLCMQNTNNIKGDAGIMVFGGTDARLHQSEMRFAKVQQKSTFFWQLRIRKLFVVSADDDGTDTNSATNWAEVVTDDMAEDSLTPIVDSGTTYSYMDRSFEAPLREAWESVTSIEFGSSSYSATEMAQLPTFWFQFEGVEGGIGTNNSTDPDHPDDILVKLPPSSYLNELRWRLYFDASEPKMVLGANFMSGHDVLFDNETHRIGFAESDCVLDSRPLADDNETSGASPIAVTSAFVLLMQVLVQTLPL